MESEVRRRHGPLLQSVVSPSSTAYYGDWKPVSRYPHNLALASVLVPAFVLCVFSPSLLGPVATGLLAGLVLELAHVQEGLLMSAWIATVWITISFSLDAHVEGLAVLLLGSVLVLCFSMWASLQFLWFQSLLPGLCILFERLLFSLAGLCAIGLLSWRGISHFGMEHAPFVVFAVQHYVFAILSLPRATAFREQSRQVFDASEYYILSYPESMVALVSYLVFPILMHVTMFRSVLFSTEQLCNAALLVSLPLLGLFWMWPRSPLWMLNGVPRVLQGVRTLTVAVPALLLPAALCFRIVFPSYMDDLPLPQPLSHILMLVAVYGATGLVLAVLAERVSSARVHQLVLVVASLCALGACVALGAPWWIWPFAAGAAGGMAQFYASRKPQPYLISLGCLTVCLLWFLSSKLAFVSFHFARANVPLSSVLGLLASVFVGAFLLLGLFLARQPVRLNDAALLVYSTSFALAEWLLAFGHDRDDHVLYPEYLVGVSSLVGMYLCHVSSSAKVVSRAGSWSAACVWLAKSSALVCHSRDSFSTDVLALLTLWCIAPIAYRWNAPKTMPVSQLLFHVATSAVVALVAASTNVAVCFAEFVLPEAAVQSSIVMYGAALACWSLYALVVALRFARAPLARALAFFLFLSGCAIVLFQPEVFDWSNSFGGDMDDSLMGAAASASASPWAKWMLLASILQVVAVAVIPVLRNLLKSKGLWFFSVSEGVTLGLFFYFQFVETSGWLEDEVVVALVLFQGLFCAGTCAAVQMLVEIALQTGQVGRLGVRMAAVGAAYSLCYVLASSDALRVSLLAWWALCALVFALAVAVQAGVLAVVRAGDESVTLSRFDRDEKRRSALKRQTAGDQALPQIETLSASDVLWRRTLGNISTLACVVLALFLSVWHLEASSAIASLVLAPLLLLLSDDKRLVLVSSSRFTPPILFVSSVAVVFGLIHSVTGAESTVKNIFLILLSLPSLVLLARRHQSSSSIFWILVSWPGTIPALLFANVQERIVIFALASTWTLVSFVLWFNAGSSTARNKI
jgi:hypothetical protein